MLLLEILHNSKRVDLMVAREVVGLKRRIPVLTGWLADGEGKGDSKTSEVMGVVIPAGDQGVREFTGEVEEGPCLLEDCLQEVDSALSSTGRGPAGQADFIVSNLEGPAGEEVGCLSQGEQSDPERSKRP